MLKIWGIIAMLGIFIFPVLLALSLISPRLALFWSRNKSKKKAIIVYSSLFTLCLVAAIALPTLIESSTPAPTESTTPNESPRPEATAAPAIQPPPTGNELDKFMAWVRSVDPDGNVISDAKVDPQFPETVEVTVTVNFLAQNKDVQLEGAAGLQRGWASIVSPTEPDKARIWLRTPSGKRFGGSRAIAGSMIYIDD